MTDLLVDTASATLTGAFGRVPCRLGRGGVCAPDTKREGDGCTPLGRWPIRGALFRRDRFALPAALMIPWRWIARDDGWSDDPRDPAYNRPVRHPHPFSAERLWRDDGLYDAVLVIGHNDQPVVPGSGSAIFLHLSADACTEGCVAVGRDAMAALLPAVTSRTLLVIA